MPGHKHRRPCKNPGETWTSHSVLGRAYRKFRCNAHHYTHTAENSRWQCKAHLALVACLEIASRLEFQQGPLDCPLPLYNEGNYRWPAGLFALPLVGMRGLLWRAGGLLGAGAGGLLGGAGGLEDVQEGCQRQLTWLGDGGPGPPVLCHLQLLRWLAGPLVLILGQHPEHAHTLGTCSDDILAQ